MEEFALIRDLAIVWLAALMAGYLCVRLRQPLIAGYLLAGVAIGSFWRNVIIVTEGIHACNLAVNIASIVKRVWTVAELKDFIAQLNSVHLDVATRLTQVRGLQARAAQVMQGVQTIQAHG